MVPEIKSVDLPTGVKLQYVEQGDPSGVPVVLLHGLSDSWHSFELVLPHLPESMRAFALTQRGHGDASRPEAYRFCDFAADVAAFMDAVHLERALLVGHSMGTVVAQRFALDYPKRTLGLVLVGSFFSLPNNPAAPELWSVVSEMEDPVDPGFVRGFQESTLARPVPQGFFETVVQESMKLPARVWKAAVAGGMQDEFQGSSAGSVLRPSLSGAIRMEWFLEVTRMPKRRLSRIPGSLCMRAPDMPSTGRSRNDLRRIW